MSLAKLLNFIQIFLLILIIKFCNTTPWSSYSPYGINDRSRFWSRFPPSMTPYGQFGRLYGNAGIQGMFRKRKIQF